MLADLPKDLHQVIADKLDVVTLLNLFSAIHLKLTQNYWRNRVSKLSFVKNLSDWEVFDWRETLRDITYLHDYHFLTYAVSGLRDFLIREFSVGFLSEFSQNQSYGYFALLEEIKNFLSRRPNTNCRQHNNDCLCQFHYHLSQNKEFIKTLIKKYSKQNYFVHYNESWLSFLDINTNNFYYQIAYDSLHLKISKNISFIKVTNRKYLITDL
jgi:hypothetical protein